MSDEERYRRHAKFCREQASLLRGPEAERWAGHTDEYERLADVAAEMSGCLVGGVVIRIRISQAVGRRKRDAERLLSSGFTLSGSVHWNITGSGPVPRRRLTERRYSAPACKQGDQR